MASTLAFHSAEASEPNTSLAPLLAALTRFAFAECRDDRVARIVVLKAVHGLDALPELVFDARERAEKGADRAVGVGQRVGFSFGHVVMRALFAGLGALAAAFFGALSLAR